MEQDWIYVNPSRAKNWALAMGEEAAPFKVFWFCLADADENQRAEYEHGELAKLLGMTHQRLTAAIKRAKEIGLIEPASNNRCIVFGPRVRTNVREVNE
ncbi:MarR family transcriptional regulator [Micromonospora tulbaghiae]|uniref:MarR family transcriptional regulator n=1 Tax=Micromonospora tulbaghiae TaxID=479978 RepID=UPI0013C458D3|nr:helix-turn-helix domain-containing protein [Micromonospora tulbaghiae]